MEPATAISSSHSHGLNNDSQPNIAHLLNLQLPAPLAHRIRAMPAAASKWPIQLKIPILAQPIPMPAAIRMLRRLVMAARGTTPPHPRLDSVNHARAADRDSSDSNRWFQLLGRGPTTPYLCCLRAGRHIVVTFLADITTTSRDVGEDLFSCSDQGPSTCSRQPAPCPGRSEPPAAGEAQRKHAAHASHGTGVQRGHTRAQ